jgi:iron complex transport system ATP-binding protein
MIQIQDLTLAYGKRTLLSGATTSVAHGTLTALIGRNGAGKSTLLRAVAGLTQPQSGKIYLNGLDTHRASTSQLARTVAMVTTERVRVSNLRCRDVVALGRAPFTNWIGRARPEDSEIIDAALQRVGMADFARRTMDTMSDGECQRIMLARALAQDTPIILLDEPTSFLDVPNRRRLTALLASLAHDEGKCIIFSTHELELAFAEADTVMLLDPPSLHHLPAAEMAASSLPAQAFE